VGAGGATTKRRGAWLAGTLGVVFLLLGTGAFLAGAAVGNSADGVGPNATNSAKPGRSVPEQVPVATHLRTCSIAKLAANSELASFHGSVQNASTGEVLFDRKGDKSATPAGLVQLLTASAALTILGADYRLSTRVYDGGTPGTIVLVGGGDPTLSRLHAGDESVYTGAPKLDELATEVTTNYNLQHPGVPITNIVLDASMWSEADNWDSTWSRSQQTGGFLSEITALQVDGDRSNPHAQVSARGTDPVLHAGQLFESAMGLSGLTFTRGTAITSKPLLGHVESQPLSTLIKQMLLTGDETLAETMARDVSSKMGFGGGAASLKQAIPSALAIYEVDTSAISIRDGSGLSTKNNVPPAFMANFLTKVVAGSNDLKYVYNGLSVAGKSGSLAVRFLGTSAVARGQVKGKASGLTIQQSIAGIVTASDGSQLTFAFYAIRNGMSQAAKPALDALVAGVYKCGSNIANN
jgi:serine-type D-Ala-D-Ala carboxypeptidase/endopeptidase (penicillin-binding protein 4)